jgi:hypothetical protein
LKTRSPVSQDDRKYQRSKTDRSFPVAEIKNQMSAFLAPFAAAVPSLIFLLMLHESKFIPYECASSDSTAARRIRKIMLRFIFLSLILFCIASPSFAATNVVEESFQRGVAAFRRGDYATAVNEWHPLAEQGHAEPQFALGLMYAKGQGVPQDFKEAAAWHRKAAEQGHAAAQYTLGFAHYVGQGVQKDYKEAATWYQKVANQGIAEAQSNLGAMYKKGEGIRQDYQEALKWFRRAAERGNRNAQGYLGSMYAEGNGVPQDYKESIKWFRKAAEQGSRSAQGNLGVMYAQGRAVPQDYVYGHMWLTLAGMNGDQDAVKNRHMIESRMTKSQTDEAQRLARDWISKHRNVR